MSCLREKGYLANRFPNIGLVRKTKSHLVWKIVGYEHDLIFGPLAEMLGYDTAKSFRAGEYGKWVFSSGGDARTVIAKIITACKTDEWKSVDEFLVYHQLYYWDAEYIVLRII